MELQSLEANESSRTNFCTEEDGLFWFGLIWFYGILTTVRYLMPNSFLNL